MKTLIIGATLIASLSGNLYAEEKDFSLTTLNYSYHYEEREGDKKPWNQKHDGIGFEYKKFGYMHYTNSFGRSANTIYVKLEDNVAMTPFVGFATKYGSEASGGDSIFPMAGVIFKYKYFRAVVTPIVAAVGLDIPLF